jgi:hypothetical protein
VVALALDKGRKNTVTRRPTKWTTPNLNRFIGYASFLPFLIYTPWLFS